MNYEVNDFVKIVLQTCCRYNVLRDLYPVVILVGRIRVSWLKMVVYCVKFALIENHTTINCSYLFLNDYLSSTKFIAKIIDS